MKDRTIFILGGSSLQVDLLRRAKERYHVILVDGNPDCALRDESDDFVHLDFSDVERLYELALVRKPTLVLTMASEPGNLAAALISERLGLRYNSADVVYATINKIRMKACLTGAGIPTGRYIVVASEEKDAQLGDDFGFPLIVKPSQSSAGRGVRLVESMSEMNEAISTAKAISKDGCALVEEFIAGEQYSIETISCEGRHSVLGVTREYFGEPPFFAETQQMFPANIDLVLQSRIEACVLDTLSAFGVRYGACHVELRVSSTGELNVIEIASRMGGWRSEMIKTATGVDYAEALLRSYEHSSLQIVPLLEEYCIVKMIFDESDLAHERLLRKNPSYSLSKITWLKESFVESQRSLMDSAGYYFVKANNLEDAQNAL